MQWKIDKDLELNKHFSSVYFSSPQVWMNQVVGFLKEYSEGYRRDTFICIYEVKATFNLKFLLMVSASNRKADKFEALCL